VAWETTGWRIAGWDTPFWSGPNRRAGRYNRAALDATQYLCLHPWGPWAEVLRWDDRRTTEDAAELSVRLWSVRVTLPDAPRRISFDDAATLGVDASDLVAEDYSVCQDLADEARAQGELALVVPSAALPGTETLVLLGPRVLTPWQLPPVDLTIDVPAAVTTDRGGPPLTMLPHVRWRNAPHRGLEDWRAGRPVDFLEPLPTPI
jgi:RES domain-containing protein